ncbi:MAG: dihydroorotate dehydrogenase-like protein [Alkalispirochaeta sp.]
MTVDIRSSYMGLPLTSPVIAASCGITGSVENIRRLEAAGAGAVVLKSLFEEEIVAEMDGSRVRMERPGFAFPETAEMEGYIDEDGGMTTYLKLVSDAKEQVKIPVIASVNCFSAGRWTSFAELVERAGADALELNVFLMPSDVHATDSRVFEQTYFDIVQAVQDQVQIPVAIKVSYHFTLLARTLKALSETGVAGLVLFNRFFNPDFDLDSLEIIPANVLSSPELLHLSLRWVAILRGQVSVDIAASTGVHDGEAVIKQILAGANAVQVASVLYRSGIETIGAMNDRLREWMGDHGYARIEDFRGRLSQAQVADPAAFDRVQFVRNYRGFSLDE